MRFDELSIYFDRLEAAAVRLEVYRLLGDLFCKANPDEAAEIAYLSRPRRQDAARARPGGPQALQGARLPSGANDAGGTMVE